MTTKSNNFEEFTIDNVDDIDHVHVNVHSKATFDTN